MERTPCLWNPKDPAYKKKQERKSEVWREVSKEVGVSAAKLRSKWASLKSTYRVHRTKFDKQIPFAWYAYDAMSFLEGLLDKKPSPAFVAVDAKDPASELYDETKSEEVHGEEDDYGCKYIIEEIVDQAAVQPETQDKGMHIESTPTSRSSSSTSSTNSSSSSSSSSTTTSTPLIVQAVQGQVDRSCWPQPDRCKLFSQCVSMRMVNFSLQQQSFAEKIINDILFEGEQGRLTAEHVYSVELEMQRLRSAMWFQSA
uniref:MADF domain-containing protein n=1 Tax=Anopheles quadriannulatus TaxID=34691 RepID=A0A182XQU2_ANOQN